MTGFSVIMPLHFNGNCLQFSCNGNYIIRFQHAVTKPLAYPSTFDLC